MDDTEDDRRYPPNNYGMSQGYGSSNSQKFVVRNAGQNVSNNRYVGDDDVDDEEEEEIEDDEDDENEGNGVQRLGRDEYEDEDDNDEDDDDGEMQRHPKKRKLKSLLSSYEFAPRVPAPSSAAHPASAAAPKPTFGGRNSVADWSEHETFILLGAWGNKFLQHGRKSLRSEEWQEVAEKVSQQSKIERTDTQCRNRLDTLKKKYKKEKAKLSEIVNFVSKWVYFQKMDMLMSSSPQQGGLSCGIDSGEYVFMNPREYLNRSHGLDEMRDSPGNSESAEAEEDDSEGLPPKRTKSGRDRGNGASFKLLAVSIEKFSEIYEKIENSKRQQMLELEKMRMDLYRELELQKRQILERAQAEIAKIRQGGDEDNDVSA
ncbi:hypothetical protein ACH5RR_008107 [Cinchona calisaya]|uniref:Myb/SANT-like DNA-binding domain-containing protein n=1 Tax=Cinchona calisaya TaxID=153742 RepID=A0ABD3AAE5_9GENT